MARWIGAEFEGIDAFSVDYLDLRYATDTAIAEAARQRGAVVLTKDADFADEVERKGTPPVIWIRAGNTSRRAMRKLLSAELPAALDAIRNGASLVEIGAGT